jgi:hypothetical protein
VSKPTDLVQGTLDLLILKTLVLEQWKRLSTAIFLIVSKA